MKRLTHLGFYVILLLAAAAIVAAGQTALARVGNPSVTVSALSGLTDTLLTLPTYGDVLMYNGTKWSDSATSSIFAQDLTTAGSPSFAELTVSNASTTALSALTAAFGATATSSIAANGTISTPAITSTATSTFAGVSISPTGAIRFPDGTYQTTAPVASAGVWSESGSDIYSNNAGNVGIGTTSPFGKLSGSFSNASSSVLASTSVYSTAGTYAWDASSVSNIDYIVVKTIGGGGGGGALTDNNAGGGGGGAYVISSAQVGVTRGTIYVAGGGGGAAQAGAATAGTGYKTGGAGAGNGCGGGGGSSAFTASTTAFVQIAAGGGGGGSGGLEGGEGASGTVGGLPSNNGGGNYCGGGGGAGVNGGTDSPTAATGATAATFSGGPGYHGNQGSPYGGGGGGSGGGASHNGYAGGAFSGTTGGTGGQGSAGAAGGSAGSAGASGGITGESGGGGGGGNSGASGGAAGSPGSGGGGAGSSGTVGGAGGSGEVIIQIYTINYTATSPFLDFKLGVNTSTTSVLHIDHAGNISIGATSSAQTTNSGCLGTCTTFLTVAGNSAINAINIAIIAVRGAIANVWYTFWSIDKWGHILTGGAAPTCGTGCAAVAGDDINMRITAGSSVSAITANFGNAYSKTPVCIATEESGGVVAINASSTPSTVVINTASAVTSVRFGVHCEQSGNFTF